MRKKSTRLLSAALAVCMMLSVLPVGAFAAEPGAEEQENGASAQADPVDSEFVEINNTNFPDQAFRKYVEDNIDKADTTTGQKDDKLSKAERDAVTEINIDNKNCTNLTGIAYFANLKKLYCNNNKLKELNLENNKNLKVLDCSYNELTTLDVSHNVWLDTLECANNGMEKLNLGGSELEGLFCSDNNLTELDVSKNKYLQRLNCQKNKLRKLVIGSPVYRLGMMLYLQDNQLTSLDLNGKGEIWNFDVASQSYAIDVNEDGTFDLTSLPEGFDASKTTNWKGGTRDENTLNVNSHEVRYEYNTGSSYYKQDTMRVILKVNGHKYRWQHDDTKHWRTCELEGCSGLTGAQEAKAPHVYDNAKDNDCNTCGYVRPMYTVTAVNATAKLESEAEELNAPVAAGTEVTLTAGNAPEGKTFAGWKLYQVVNDTESEITDEIELAKLLRNGTETTATLTMPAYNVKAEPYYSNIPYNIKAVNCTVDKTEAAKGDTVTATRREPEANERFTGWTVKVNGVKQPDDFLTPDANDHAKVRFTMPDENVEIKANFEGNPTLNIGDHVTANIDDNDASVPSGSAVPVGETVHLTAIAPEGQHFIGWTVKVGDEEQKADTFLTTPNANDPTKVTFTMPSENVEVTANFASNPTLNPTLRVGDHVTATIEGSDASVPSGSTVPVPKNKIVHLTATAPGQHFISWTVKVNGVEQDPTFLKPDADDPTKVTFTMPDANVEVAATFADDPIPEPDPVGPSDTGNIQGAISAVVIGAAAGVIAYEAGTGIYRVINMPGIPMPSNRIELAELLWEHAGKPEPVSTALYSDIDEGDTDAQKAARWAVEQDLMKDDADNNKFHPAFPVSKLRTCLTWNAAKEKGLFDKTEE